MAAGRAESRLVRLGDRSPAGIKLTHYRSFGRLAIRLVRAGRPWAAVSGITAAGFGAARGRGEDVTERLFVLCGGDRKHLVFGLDRRIAGGDARRAVLADEEDNDGLLGQEDIADAAADDGGSGRDLDFDDLEAAAFEGEKAHQRVLRQLLLDLREDGGGGANGGIDA